MTVKRKSRNQQDATLRNIRASRAATSRLAKRVATLERIVEVLKGAVLVRADQVYERSSVATR